MNCVWCGAPLHDETGKPRFEVFTDTLPSSSPYANRIVGELIFVCYERCAYRLPVPDRIVCAGRALDDQGRAEGEPCGRRWHKQCRACLGGDTEAHGRGLVQMARACGWKLGPRRDDGSHDAICPSCARPNPDLVKMCQQLAVTHA